jgi:chromosome segregation ATPase
LAPGARAAENPNGPIKSRDWTYTKKALTGDTAAFCVAETQKTFEEKVWTFYFVVDPTRKAPPTLYVNSAVGDLGATLQLQTNSSRTLFTHLRDTAADARVAGTAYWFASEGLADFYSQIRRDSNIKVAYKTAEGVDKKFYFSLSGSMATLDNLKKYCDERKEVIYEDFFDSLDRARADDSTSNLKGIANLQETLKAAWGNFFVTGKHAAEIKRIDTAMRPLLREEEAYLRRTGRLNGELDEQRQEKAEIEVKKARDVAERDRLKAELASTERSLVTALATLETKRAAYEPAAAEARPYFDARDAARRTTQSYANAIASNESDLSTAESRIASLERRSRELLSEIDSLEDDERDAEREYNTAKSNYESFNYDWEYRRAVDADWQVRNLESAIATNRSNISRYQSDERRAEQDLRQAERDLERCRNSGTPETPPNCSSEESRKRQAESNLEQARRNLQNEEQQLASNERQLENRKSQIANETRARQNALREKMNDEAEELAEVRDDLRDAEREYEDIIHFQIPRQRDIADNAREELRRLRPLYEDAKREQARKQADLDAVLARTDYVRKKSEFEAATVVVADLQSKAATLDAGIQTAERSIASRDRALARIQTEIDATLAELARETAGLDVIEAQLNPLRAEKQVHVDGLAVTQAQLLTQMRDYRRILRNTLQGEVPVMAPAAARFYHWAR